MRPPATTVGLTRLGNFYLEKQARELKTTTSGMRVCSPRRSILKMQYINQSDYPKVEEINSKRVVYVFNLSGWIKLLDGDGISISTK
jgi:hypothetical protein